MRLLAVELGIRSCLVSFFPEASVTNVTPLMTTVRLCLALEFAGLVCGSVDEWLLEDGETVGVELLLLVEVEDADPG